MARRRLRPLPLTAPLLVFVRAVIGSRRRLRDKLLGQFLPPSQVVLDVGCGTGVLSLACARLGARVVYAVEASPMAHLARKIVAANGMADVVQVLHRRAEEAQLPEKVGP